MQLLYSLHKSAPVAIVLCQNLSFRVFDRLSLSQRWAKHQLLLRSAVFLAKKSKSWSPKLALMFRPPLKTPKLKLALRVCNLTLKGVLTVL